MELGGRGESKRRKKKAADAAAVDGIEELRGGVEGVTAIDSLPLLPPFPHPIFHPEEREGLRSMGDKSIFLIWFPQLMETTFWCTRIQRNNEGYRARLKGGP